MMKVLQLVGIFAASADFSWGRPSACGGLSGRLFWLRLRCSVGQTLSLRGSSRTRSSRANRPAWTPAAGLESRPTIIP